MYADTDPPASGNRRFMYVGFRHCCAHVYVCARMLPVVTAFSEDGKAVVYALCARGAQCIQSDIRATLTDSGAAGRYGCISDSHILCALAWNPTLIISRLTLMLSKNRSGFKQYMMPSSIGRWRVKMNE